MLHAWSRGDEGARDEAMRLVYAELRRRAASRLASERRGHTLDPTGLVHELYLRLAGRRAPWRNRSHFFGFASNMMRRILVDHARRRRSAKRGGVWFRLPLDEVLARAETRPMERAVEDALRDLGALDPPLAQLVELRFRAGLTIEETAEFLERSPATVKRQWELARAWLHRHLSEEPR